MNALVTAAVRLGAGELALKLCKWMAWAVVDEERFYHGTESAERLQRANKYLALALKIKPADPDVLFYRASVFRVLGNHLEALKCIEAIDEAELGPGEKDYRIAMAYTGFGLYSRAEALFRASLRKGGGAVAATALAHALCDQGRFDDASEVVEVARARFEDWPELDSLARFVQEKMHGPEELLPQLEAFYRQHPTASTAAELASALATSGNYKEAREMLTRARSFEDCDSEDTAMDIYFALRDLGEWEEAEKWCLLHLEKSTTPYVFYWFLCRTTLEQGRPGTALEYCNKALEAAGLGFISYSNSASMMEMIEIAVEQMHYDLAKQFVDQWKHFSPVARATLPSPFCEYFDEEHAKWAGLPSRCEALLYSDIDKHELLTGIESIL